MLRLHCVCVCVCVIRCRASNTEVEVFFCLSNMEKRHNEITIVLNGSDSVAGRVVSQCDDPKNNII